MDMIEIIRHAAKRYETPFYLFDLDCFQKRISAITKLTGNRVKLCYAIKANPFLTRMAASCLRRLEVCSPGEFAICERLEIPMEKIVLSGVYKEKKEIHRIFSQYGGKGVYTVESLQQFRLLAEEAEEMGLRIAVLLRLTSGNQFGMDEEQIHELIKNRSQYPQMMIRGLQFYSGTQKKKKNVMEGELARLDQLLAELKERWGYQAKELEYGPGLYVPYFQKEEEQSLEETIGELNTTLSSMAFRGNIILEMGRYLAAMCGAYVTRLVDLKQNNGQSYAIVDGGINHLNYYGQTMAMKVPWYHHLSGKTLEPREGELIPVTVCGSLCTVSDVLVKNLPLADPQLQDVLVFERTGAYSVTEGIYLFLSRDLPQILFWSEQEGLQLVREHICSHWWNGEVEKRR